MHSSSRIFKVDKHHPADYSYCMMDHSYYDYLIDYDCDVVGPSGEYLGSLIKNKISSEVLKQSWGILKDYNPVTKNRGVASGEPHKYNKRSDGSESATTESLEVSSGVIGFMDRYERFPYCRKCAFNDHNPDKFQYLLPLFKEVSDLHKQRDPVGWGLTNKWASATNPDFVIPGTPYTTVTVNKNFRTAAHLDAQNLKEATCAMLLMRQGQFSGGYVVFPEWRFAMKMDTGDVCIFRNMKDFHGNTRIIPISPDYQRCTLVFYYREGMINCGSVDEELEFIRNKPFGDPLKISLNPRSKEFIGE